MGGPPWSKEWWGRGTMRWTRPIRGLQPQPRGCEDLSGHPNISGISQGTGEATSIWVAVGWRGGNSPTAGDMCWALAVLGPAGLRSGGRTKPPQLRHILPAWGAMRGHPCLLAVIRDTSWGLVTGASIATRGSGLGWEVGGCVPPLPCFPELGDAMLSPTKPGFVSGPTLGSP